MSDWFIEQDNDELKVGFAYSNEICRAESDFQSLRVLQTSAYGKMLILDECVMLTDVDEFVYHEMISHIPMCLHPNPKSVVVIGGGDGGTVRELLKHPGVERITLCEIDGLVIDTCKEHFPNVAGDLSNPKVDVRVADGVEYMSTLENEADLIIIDSTDPVGPGEGLFTGKFYSDVKKALRQDGMMVAQSESPWADAEFLNRIHRNIAQGGFENIMPYVAPIPSYPRGMWSWTVAGGRAFTVDRVDWARFENLAPSLRYLNEGIYRSAFSAPKFYLDKLSEI